MNKLKPLNNIMIALEKFYIYLFSLYAALGSINLTHGSIVITPIMWFCFLLGFCIILYRIINFKKYIKAPAFAALMLLFFSICLSTLLNYKYSFKENFVLCIYWAIFFFIIYLRRNDESPDETLKDSDLFLEIFVCCVTVAVIASFVLLAAGVSKRFFLPGTENEVYVGFVSGRLWGIFLNPNSGALSAAISAAALLYFAEKTKRKIVKIIYAADILLMLAYIALSDSRTGAVTNGIIFGIYFLCRFLYKTKDKKIIFKFLSVILALAVAICSFLAPRLFKKGYNEALTVIHNFYEQSETENNNNFSDMIIDRGYDLSDDISNRRFDVWKGSVELFADSPSTVIYGSSFKGFTEYAREHQPDNYIVNNDYMDMTTLDNDFFNILTANGLIGVFSAVFLIIAIIILIIKNYFKIEDKYHSAISLWIASVFGVAAAAMFGSFVFYNFSPNAILFWFILGSAATLLKNSKETK